MKATAWQFTAQTVALFYTPSYRGYQYSFLRNRYQVMVVIPIREISSAIPHFRTSSFGSAVLGDEEDEEKPKEITVLSVIFVV